MKCSQCGCQDLIPVDFPQKTNLEEVDCGLAGYSSAYVLKNKINCDSFICINCGHFEFFNLGLAEQIKHDRKLKKEIQENINKVENEIMLLNNKAFDIQEQIGKLKSETLNLDITLRRNNELQVQISNLKKELAALNKTINEKKKLINNLKVKK